MRFRRTRDDHSTETAEDYVEAIDEMIEQRGECRITWLAEEFGVSHVTALKTVRRLAREGLTRVADRQPVGLTRKGRRLARYCRDRHEAVYRFLLAIGVSERSAAIDTEGIEHHVSTETLERMRQIADARPE